MQLLPPFDLVLFGGTGDLAMRKLLPAMYRRKCTGQMTADSRVIGAARIRRDAPPAMGAEDFSYMLEQRPGCMIKLGQRGPDGRGGVPLHHPDYDFNDEAAPIGASILAAIVEQELSRAG